MSVKPLFLLADSQPLFFHQGQSPFLNRVREQFDVTRPLKAAYIGAANGDKIEFYEIFTLAMLSIGVTHCKHITSALSAPELDFLQQADIILFAGGDVWRGWQTLQKINLQLHQARQNGAALIGISAGAMHLGQLGWHDKKQLLNNDLFATLGYCPLVFSAHEETSQWNHLKQVIGLTAGCVSGIGIPTGSGVIFHPDGELEALRNPAVSITLQGNQLHQQNIWRFGFARLIVNN